VAVGVAALVELVMVAGCTPGPVTARMPDDKTTGTGGADVRVVVRDAAVAGADAAMVARGTGGNGGAGGTARPTMDAGQAIDGSSAEMPKLPRRDAGAGQAPDATTDVLLGDAAADPPVARAPRAGEIVIDELLVNPTGDDLGREWVEITNLAAEPLDLSQLHLATASTDVPVPAGTIAPGALLLLGQSSDPSKNGGAPVAVAYNTKLILVNANGQLSLCVGVCASGVIVDAVTWGTLDDGYTGHALVIDPATRMFCPAGAAFGTGGSFGTPGAPNPPCAQNVDAGSQRDVSVAD
jgi:hypothetical protein